jgi:hypothetical protein
MLHLSIVPEKKEFVVSAPRRRLALKNGLKPFLCPHSLPGSGNQAEYC